ncbi:heme-binding Shp domain-containing protein [Faecalimonas sp.]
MKKWKETILGVGLAVVLAALPVSVYAMEDGAYTVGRTTSYANPETNKTVDGGTNIALGDSMADSIVEDNALVEQSNGKTYVTLGIGLISNVKNVRIQIKGNNGKYRNAELTQTGTCERDGDTCNHYRFEVDSAENYISPILFVEPMGRDVQFFIKLNMETAQKGNGNFVSQMIKAEEKPAPKEEKPKEIKEKPTTKSEQKAPIGTIAVGVVTVIVIGSVVVFIKKRK